MKQAARSSKAGAHAAPPRAVAAGDTLLEMITAGWMAQAIRTAVELRLPELLADGHREVAVLASRAGCRPYTLERLLGALAALGLVHEEGEGFVLTTEGERLCSAHPASLAATSVWWGRHLWPLWEGLPDSVRQGISVRQLRRGQRGFEHLADDPAALAVFQQAMAETTRLAVPDILAAHDFGRARRIVDVGGGNGELLVHVLGAHRRARGILLELPAVLSAARARIAEAGLSARCACVAGSFFDPLPPGGDAYLLKNVLHNWNDVDGERILVRCREAMGPDARLIVVERARAESAAAPSRGQARADLNMLVSLGGRERSVREFGVLLRAAGFGVVESGREAFGYRVMVASPA